VFGLPTISAAALSLRIYELPVSLPKPFRITSSVSSLRLPQREREEFLKKYNPTLYEACGTVMKAYVTVPEALLKDTKAVEKHLAVSYAYVKTLQPNATKKKR
jgi:hypothetical protein